ncbi:MAG: hypothetical protein HY321_05065 [Armatimonadetes bacterium]|nr:hypothetical protein [Armatimonadota bacterium]
MLTAAGCARRKPPPAPPKPTPAAPKTEFNAAVSVSGLRWSVPDLHDRPLWEMRAGKGSSTVASGLAELEDVRCKVYSEGVLALEAEAPRVKADYAGKRLTLYGGVSARTTDGARRFRAERVSLHAKDRQRAVIEAAGAVRLDLDGASVEGARLVTNPHLTEGRILGK